MDSYPPQNSHLEVDKTARFIKSFSWIMVIFFGFSALSSLVQGIFFCLKPPLEFLQQFQEARLALDLLPPILMTLLKDYHLHFSFLSALMSLVILIASLAMLKRRNWGRLVLVIALLLPLIFILAGLVFRKGFLLRLPESPEMREIYYGLNLVWLIGLVIFAASIILIHGWLILKLLSKELKNYCSPDDSR